MHGWPYSIWWQCETRDHRWNADAQCIEKTGHEGKHVRETARGNFTYWSDADEAAAKAEREDEG